MSKRWYYTSYVSCFSFFVWLFYVYNIHSSFQWKCKDWMDYPATFAKIQHKKNAEKWSEVNVSILLQGICVHFSFFPKPCLFNASILQNKFHDTSIPGVFKLGLKSHFELSRPLAVALLRFLYFQNIDQFCHKTCSESELRCKLYSAKSDLQKFVEISQCHPFH